MGLLSFLFKDPVKLEQQGDALIAQKSFGAAKLEYDKALEAFGRKQPVDDKSLKRVQEKIVGCKEALASTHMENAEELIESGCIEEACSLLSLAMELTESQSIRENIHSRISSLVTSELPKEELEINTGETMSENSELDVSDVDEFYALCGTYPEEIETAYISYGNHFMKGLLALAKGHYREALVALNAADIEHSESDTFIPLEIASALIGSGEFDEAEAVLIAFLKYHPDTILGIRKLCDVYCTNGKFQKAHELLDTASDSVQEFKESGLIRGNLYFLEGKFDEAEKVFRGLLTSFEWDETVVRSLVACLEASAKLEDAKNLTGQLLNKCVSCHQKPLLYDKLKYADLSFALHDHSEKLIELYLTIADEDPEFQVHCFGRVQQIFQALGDESASLSFQKKIESLTS